MGEDNQEPGEGLCTPLRGPSGSGSRGVSSRQKIIYAPSRARIGDRMTRQTVTGVQCPVCWQRIFSTHRHDMRYCFCGTTFVDGGRDYLRFGSEAEETPRIVRRDLRVDGIWTRPVDPAIRDHLLQQMIGMEEYMRQAYIDALLYGSSRVLVGRDGSVTGARKAGI